MLRREKNNGGFVILLVLVAVAILMLLYFVQIDAFFGPGLPSERGGIEEHPWVLEELLVADGEDIKLPRSPKPDMEELFSVSAPVRRKEAHRGTIAIEFDTNGRIKAQWQCVYEQTGQKYQIIADMNGNIHIKRTYQDEAGKDKSRLFFIARGHYTKTPIAPDGGAGGEKGTSWVTGWISPDHTVQGHITLTMDQKWAAAYGFESPE